MTGNPAEDPLAGTERWMVRYLEGVRELIAEHGHAVQAVLGDKPIHQSCYTVGLTAAGRPELWIGSFAPQLAGPVLNALLAAHPPEAFVHGAVLRRGEGDQAPMLIRGPVDVDVAEVGVARQLYGWGAVTCLQVLWPDPDGLYPDDVGYDQGRWPQRLLPLAPGLRCADCGEPHPPAPGFGQ